MIVDKNIPIPRQNYRPTTYQWELLVEVGDSMLIECDPKDENKINSIRTAAFSYGKRRKLHFTTRVVSNGIRVWRIK